MNWLNYLNLPAQHPELGNVNYRPLSQLSDLQYFRQSGLAPFAQPQQSQGFSLPTMPTNWTRPQMGQMQAPAPAAQAAYQYTPPMMTDADGAHSGPADGGFSGADGGFSGADGGGGAGSGK